MKATNPAEIDASAEKVIVPGVVWALSSARPDADRRTDAAGERSSDVTLTAPDSVNDAGTARTSYSARASADSEIVATPRNSEDTFAALDIEINADAEAIELTDAELERVIRAAGDVKVRTALTAADNVIDAAGETMEMGTPGRTACADIVIVPGNVVISSLTRADAPTDTVPPPDALIAADASADIEIRLEGDVATDAADASADNVVEAPADATSCTAPEADTVIVPFAESVSCTDADAARLI